MNIKLIPFVLGWFLFGASFCFILVCLINYHYNPRRGFFQCKNKKASGKFQAGRKIALDFEPEQKEVGSSGEDSNRRRRLDLDKLKKNNAILDSDGRKDIRNCFEFLAVTGEGKHYFFVCQGLRG